MPADVRKRSALPSCVQSEFGTASQQLGIAQNLDGGLPEGQRPSAHQTAQPQNLWEEFHINKEKYHAK